MLAKQNKKKYVSRGKFIKNVNLNFSKDSASRPYRLKGIIY